MHVLVRFHAGARDLAGTSEASIELAADSVTERELRTAIGRAHERLTQYLPRMRLAVNDEFIQVDQQLRHGDVVDVLPPVAGGAPTVDERIVRCEVVDQELDTDTALRAVTRPECGGVSIFVGVVRDHASGRVVHKLEYEAHRSLATKEMRRIMREIAVKSPYVYVYAAHRVGALSVGDVAVVVAVSSPHRAQAIGACDELIARIKESVPIWKREWCDTGEAHWVNLDAT